MSVLEQIKTAVARHIISSVMNGIDKPQFSFCEENAAIVEWLATMGFKCRAIEIPEAERHVCAYHGVANNVYEVYEMPPRPGFV